MIVERVESMNSLLAKASMIQEIEITEKIIVDSVAKYFNSDADLIRSASRKREVLIPRYCAIAFIYLSVKKEKNGIIRNITLYEVGKYFSRRDHSTIINSLKKLSDMIYTDPIDRENLERLLSYMHGKGLCKGINIHNIIKLNNDKI